jgi:hypothetical protein
MSQSTNKRSAPMLHRGGDRSSPYPVSRLAPHFDLVDLAKEIDQADRMVSTRLGGQLQVIAEQVRSLQAQARRILEEAREDQRLHHARCAFKRIPGHTYYLYEDPSGSPEFSMLSPEDWNGRPPKRFLGAYRLNADMSWSREGEHSDKEDSRRLVQRLLQTSEQDTGPVE